MNPYNLLIVDDEQFALDGIVHGVDWDRLGVGTLHEALDASEAQAILLAHPVDIIVCDIEMPKVNGLELLQWIKANVPDAETVILTGHADFAYVRTALQLGSFDYLLKPVDFAELEKTAAKMLRKVEERREEERYRRIHRDYYDRFQSYKPLLEEKFWQDFLARRTSPTRPAVEALIARYELGFTADGPVLPVLLSVELWGKDLAARDEELMEYAMRNIAGELVLGTSPGAIIQDRSGRNWVLFYGQDGRMPAPDDLTARCEQFVAMCNLYLSGTVSCYVGEPADFGGLLGTCVGLAEAERANVTRTNAVIPYRAHRVTGNRPAAVPWIAEISALLDLGGRRQIEGRLDEVLELLEQEEDLSVETLLSFYHALIHMLFQAFHRRGLTMQDIVSPQDLSDPGTITRSLPQFKAWCRRILAASLDRLHGEGEDGPSVIQRIAAYIEAHLAEEISREQLADYVHFNPAYLSRLFKKETGSSLTDYILAKRIDKSKQLLAGTRMKISDIAASVGYDNIPYFSRKFKKTTGVTPQEFRQTAAGAGR